MKIYDISVSLSEDLPIFPGDPSVRLRPRTGEFRVSELNCGSHSGTHLDLPGHIGLAGPKVAALPLESLIGPCLVWDFSDQQGPIDRQLLARQPLSDASRVLLRTGNSRLWQKKSFHPRYQALTEDAAAWLVEHKIALIGIDYLSVEEVAGAGAVHRLLLQAGTLILEGLDLSQVPSGRYELICLPLKILGEDGGPCRAVLRSL